MNRDKDVHILLNQLYSYIHASGNTIDLKHFPPGSVGELILSSIGVDPLYFIDQKRTTNIFESTGHRKLELASLIPVYFFVIAVFAIQLQFHFRNPCVKYTDTLYWFIGGFYIWYAVTTLCNMMIKDLITWFCNQMSCKNHLVLECIFACVMTSSLGFYSMYTIFLSPFAALGAFISLVGSIICYVPCFINRHYRKCELRGHDHVELVEGDKRRMIYCFYAFDVIWAISIIVFISGLFWLDFELRTSERLDFASTCLISYD